uniref:Uncharacterized protein n=1 Tax=Eubacterium cellulosolvens (strain ATCC 43171 / JCM 9499 / 6) TaxID=633697 RepID=I5AU63_EUBC6
MNCLALFPAAGYAIFHGKPCALFSILLYNASVKPERYGIGNCFANPIP